MANTIWDILGIPPTSDKKAIKKAYAVKCANCHPEEHPEEFDRLHRAYAAAVKMAARASEDKQMAATAGEQNMAPANNQTSAPPSIPDISQLVEQGMAQELKSSCSKLIESLQILHDSFPISVNTNQEELTKALLRMEGWYESPRFKLAGWEPDFIRQLDQWLSMNKDNINRAEVIALYKAYRFRYFKMPSYPFIPYMNNIYWEVMRYAVLYENDMIAMANMPPPPGPEDSHRHMSIYLHLILFSLIMISLILLNEYIIAPSPSSHTSDVQNSLNEIRQKPSWTLTNQKSSEIARKIDKIIMGANASDDEETADN